MISYIPYKRMRTFVFVGLPLRNRAESRHEVGRLSLTRAAVAPRSLGPQMSLVHWFLPGAQARLHLVTLLVAMLQTTDLEGSHARDAAESVCFLAQRLSATTRRLRGMAAGCLEAITQPPENSSDSLAAEHAGNGDRDKRNCHWLGRLQGLPLQHKVRAGLGGREPGLSARLGGLGWSAHEHVCIQLCAVRIGSFVPATIDYFPCLDISVGSHASCSVSVVGY